MSVCWTSLRQRLVDTTLIEIGQVLGHYCIVSHLGSGGMGEVWEAEDTKLKRRVALKVLPARVSGDSERLERFQREAETVAALNHPNIVTIYSVEQVVAANGETVHFLTMELVVGKTLAALQPAGGFLLPDFFDIAEQLTAAVASAHEKGVMHRDLKPINVMVNDEEHVKVLDFGLAKFHQEVAAEGASRMPTEGITGAGVVMGTAPYMSPEQAEGKPLDHRSDIFSLGVVLYEMATGHRPFAGDTHASLTSAILRDTPPSVETLKPDLPRHLSRIVYQCLEKNPKDRVQTARDVQNQLKTLRREIDSGEMPSSTQTGTAPQATFARRGRPVVALAAAAMVTAIALGAWFFLPYGKSDAPGAAAGGLPVIAVLPFENLGPTEEAYFAAGITEEISGQLAAVDGVAVTSRATVNALDRSGKSLPQIGLELGADYILDGTVRWAPTGDGASSVRITPQLIRVADDTTLWTENYDRVLEGMFALQSEIAQSVLDQLGITLFAAQLPTAEGRGSNVPQAIDAYLRGGEYFLRAGELYREEDVQTAIDYYSEAVRLDGNFALAHAKLAMAHGLADHFYIDRSEERRAKIKDAAQAALDLSDNLPEAHLAMGYYFRGGVEYELALEEFALAASGRPGDSQIVQAIAELQWYMGRTEESLATYARARRLDPRRAELFCSTGGVYRMTETWDSAIAFHNQSSELQPQRACPYYCLAMVYLNAEGPGSARAFLESIPESIGREEAPPIDYAWFQLETMDGNYDAALERLNDGDLEAYDWQQFYYPKSLLRGHVYWLQGRTDLAHDAFEEARVLLEARAEQRPGDPRIYSSLGIAYAGLGDRDRALQAGEDGRRMMPIDIDVFAGPFRLRDMAQIHVMLGEFDEAVDALAHVLAVPGEIHAPEIRLDPLWAALRNRTDFQELVAADSGDTPSTLPGHRVP